MIGRSRVTIRNIGRRHVLSLGVALAVAMGTVGPGSVQAADWPTRPVTVIVPYSAGGNTDTMARLVSSYLSQKLGQNFVVENQPAAGGVVGTSTVARAAPDGYTLLFAAATMVVIRPLLQKLDYDASNFAPISIFGEGPLILAIRSSVPATTLDELVAYAKANPGTINYASAGTGAIAHLATAKLAAEAGIEMTEIPYQGGGPASTALIAGEVDMYFGNASELLPQVDNPDIRLIAVGSAERMAALPDVPTISESFDGFLATSWNGFLAPAGTPQEIIDVIESGTIEAANDPEISSHLVALGITPIGSTAEELAAIIEGNKTFYAEGIKAAGIEVK